MWEPKINTRKHGTDMVIQLDLPGVDSSSVDIQVLERVVTISGTRVPVVDDEEWLTRESAYGPFERTVELPASVDSSAVHAELREGVLILTVNDIFDAPESHPAHVRIAGPMGIRPRGSLPQDFYDACP
ncbi:MAG: Hsp20/alpha crystallin family protein [Coriobacteriia bacterium]